MGGLLCFEYKTQAPRQRHVVGDPQFGKLLALQALDRIERTVRPSYLDGSSRLRSHLNLCRSITSDAGRFSKPPACPSLCRPWNRCPAWALLPERWPSEGRPPPRRRRRGGWSASV